MCVNRIFVNVTCVHMQMHVYMHRCNQSVLRLSLVFTTLHAGVPGVSGGWIDSGQGELKPESGHFLNEILKEM